MDLDRVIEIFSYPFMYRALIAGILISLCAALLGVILVLKRYSLIGHGLADVGFGSLSVALALGLPPILVSAPIVIIASIGIMYLSQNKNVKGDVAIGVFSTSFLAFGVIVTAMSRGFNIDVYNYMFGSILAMDNTDVWISVLLSVFVISIFILFYNRLFIITFDEDFARASGINVSLYQFLISFLTAVTVVLGMRIMGTLLISSLIIFPSITAKRLVKSFKGLVIVSSIVSVFCFILGILLSVTLNLPTGASIVIANIVVMLAAIIKNYIRGK